MKLRTTEPSVQPKPIAKALAKPKAEPAPQIDRKAQGWSATASKPAPAPQIDRKAQGWNATAAAADAAQIYKALHGGITGLGTDEKAIFSALTNRTPAHLTDVKRLYQEHYDLSLQKDLAGDLSGHALDRAQALLAGDGIQGNVESLRGALSGHDHEALLGTLDGLSPAELPLVTERFGRGGASLESEIQRHVLGPNRDVALSLVRGQRPQAQATRLDSALNLTGDSAAALQVLSTAGKELPEIGKAVERPGQGRGQVVEGLEGSSQVSQKLHCDVWHWAQSSGPNGCFDGTRALPRAASAAWQSQHSVVRPTHRWAL